ncbi:glycosyltransferase family 9 protein [Miltoncostaea marina]|uniref:glycosyltransferase family 9 protein n=1 Tax=Miltoncostaea marina TaxID=2843215 RepID=UPI001C3DDD90|nr:glycosyltransferase family 9 protein [Miltoncostaea marina]
MTHVLVARPDNDGDVLLAGPAVRAAAAHADRVTLLVGPRGRRAAALLPGVDEVLVERLPWIDPEPPPVDRGRMLALADRVAALAPDAAVILSSFHQSPLPLALILRMAGVPRLAATSVDYPGSLLDVRHGIDDDVHEVERSLSLMAAAGMPARPGDDRLEVATAPGDDALAAGLPEGYVVVHPGASVPARAWAPQRHARLVALLADRGVPVAVTGGPGERALTAAVCGPPREGVIDLGGRTGLGELAEVLRRARLAVVGNTGPAHLAAAVGCPVVWLHAPTVPAVRWHPWRVPFTRVGLPVPCAGCRARVCPVPGHPCIDEVPAEEVLAAAGAMLDGARQGVAA